MNKRQFLSKMKYQVVLMYVGIVKGKGLITQAEFYKAEEENCPG